MSVRGTLGTLRHATLLVVCTTAVLTAGCGDGGGDRGGVSIERLAGGPTIGDGGAATATFLAPRRLAVDGAGTVFVLDDNFAVGGTLVRRIDARDGTITTVAGGCARGPDDDAPTDACQLHDLAGLSARGVGDLFVTTFDGRVYRFDAARGALQHVGGRGGFDCNEDEPARSALASCIGTADATTLDAAGDLYLAEPARVRRLRSPAAPLDFVAELSASDLAIDRHGDLLVAKLTAGRVSRVDAAAGIVTTIGRTDAPCPPDRGDGGPVANACFERPGSLAVAASGDVFVADSGRLRRIDAATEVVTTVATRPHLATIASAPDGSVVFTEQGVVSRIDVGSAAVTPVAGNGTASICGEGGPARDACIGQPTGVALDRAGNVYFTDAENARIGRLDADTGVVTTVAGGRRGFCGDGGPAIAACFRNITDLAFDRAGNLYVVDRGDDDQNGSASDIVGRVRRIDAATGTITTVAGNCTQFGSPRATEACLLHPTTLLFDADDTLLVGEAAGVWRIDLADGTIRAVAGGRLLAPDCRADGIDARDACGDASDLARDDAGNLFVVDFGSSRVRRIDAASGVITTVAGNGVLDSCEEDDVPATDTCLFPYAITLDGTGRLIVAEGGRFRAVDLATGLIRTIPGGPDPAACFQPDAPSPGDCIAASDIERDAAGRLIVSDANARKISRVTLP